MRIENNLADFACLAPEGQQVGRKFLKITFLPRQEQKNCAVKMLRSEPDVEESAPGGRDADVSTAAWYKRKMI